MSSKLQQELDRGVIQASPTLIAAAPNHGLDWLPLKVFETPLAASSKTEVLFRQIDKALGAGRAAGRTLKLPSETQPIRGRLVDTEGRPLANVNVLIESLSQPNIDILMKAFERSSKDLYYDALNSSRSPGGGVRRALLRKLLPPVATNSEGEFTVAGIGRDQLATFSLRGQNIQWQRIQVLGRTMKTHRLPHTPTFPNGSKDVFFGRRFTHAVGPAVTVSGVVRDFDTGVPVPNTVVFVDRLFREGGASQGELRLDTEHMRAVTDSHGEFQIEGMPPGNGHVLNAIPPKSEPYLIAEQAISPKINDRESTVEILVKRGIWISGRITDKETGDPVEGSVNYLALQNNPNSLDKLGLRQGWTMDRYRTDENGRYKVLGLPGPGVLLARSWTKSYPLGIGAETVTGYRTDIAGGYIPTTPIGLPLSNWNLIRQIDPASDDESFKCDLTLDAGQTISGVVVGPDGELFSQLNVMGEVLNNSFWKPRANGRFEVEGYDGKGPRQLFFKSDDEDLVGQFRLEGDAPQKISVKA